MSDYTPLERLHHYGLADFHCHCDFSFDAEGTVDEYCQRALERGLVELCFTTHFDMADRMPEEMRVIRVDGELRPTSIENLAPYIDAVHKANDHWFPRGLRVRLGVEFGWYQDCEEVARKLKEAYDFEYFLVGIHELETYCFCCKGCYQSCFERYPVEEMARRYVDHLVSAAETGLFDTVAHIDYVRKYGERFYGKDEIDAALANEWPRLFDALKRHDTRLEVNTAAIRRGMDQAYPRTSVVNTALAAGVDVAYLGSDAHKPEQVGYEFDLVAPLIAKVTEYNED